MLQEAGLLHSSCIGVGSAYLCSWRGRQCWNAAGHSPRGSPPDVRARRPDVEAISQAQDESVRRQHAIVKVCKIKPSSSYSAAKIDEVPYLRCEGSA